MTTAEFDAERGRQFLLLGGHMDSWPGPQATDNAAGDACIMELSRVFQNHRDELPRGVVPLFYATNVENKRGVLLRLSARGVEGRNFWELHHPLLPAGVFPETDELRRTQLELPIHQDLVTDDIRRIAAAMRAILDPGAARSTTALAAD